MYGQKDDPGHPFRETIQGVISAAGTTELDFDPLDAGEVWSVNALTVLVGAHNATLFHILVGRYGNLKNIGSSGALTADVANRFTDGFYVFDGERIRVQVVGGTAADPITVEVEGARSWQAFGKVEVEVSG